MPLKAALLKKVNGVKTAKKQTVTLGYFLRIM